MENQTQPQISAEDLKKAKDEIEAICKKYSIALVPIVVHQGDRTFSSIEITAVTPASSTAEEQPAS
jgi:hypothetical protein